MRRRKRIHCSWLRRQILRRTNCCFFMHSSQNLVVHLYININEKPKWLFDLTKISHSLRYPLKNFENLWNTFIFILKLFKIIGWNSKKKKKEKCFTFSASTDRWLYSLYLNNFINIESVFSLQLLITVAICIKGGRDPSPAASWRDRSRFPRWCKQSKVLPNPVQLL